MSKTLNARRTSRYAYSGKIRCMEHDRFYHRARQNAKADGTPGSEYYRCPDYKAYGVRGCEAPYLYTGDLNRMMRQVFRSIREQNRAASIEAIVAAIQKAMAPDELEREREALMKRREQIEERKDRLLEGWMQKVLDDETCKSQSQKLNGELQAVERRLKELNEAEAKQAAGNVENLYAETASAMNLDSDEIVEGLVRKYLREIRVIPAGNPGEYRLDVLLDDSAVPICGGFKRVREKIRVNQNMESEIENYDALMGPSEQSASLR